jgi:RNase H-fold protein (predicted Holliday junction resolvase)
MAIDMTEKKAGVASSQQQLENRMNSMIESGIKVNVNDDNKKTAVGQKLNFSNDEGENSDERSNHDMSSIDEDEDEDVEEQ